MISTQGVLFLLRKERLKLKPLGDAFFNSRYVMSSIHPGSYVCVFTVDSLLHLHGNT